MPTNDHDLNQPAHDPHVRDSDHPGYEVTDVNSKGIVVFLAGLFGSVLIFFVLCYGLGILINGGIKQEDAFRLRNGTPPARLRRPINGKRQDLTSNTEMQQQEYNQITQAFPDPRLDIDDGNQATADLHAREDLLLNNYSKARDGTVRIPVSRAMELIAQRGLPVNTQAAATTVEMAGDEEARLLRLR